MRCTQITYQIKVPGSPPIYTVMPSQAFTGVVLPDRFDGEASKLDHLLRDAQEHGGDAVVFGNHHELGRVALSTIARIKTDEQRADAVTKLTGAIKASVRRLK